MTLERARVQSSKMSSGAGVSSGRPKIWIGVGAFVCALGLLLSWVAGGQLDALLGRLDTKAISRSANVLDTVIAQQRRDLSSAVGVLAEDARIRATVITPNFDEATVADVLKDLKATSKASMVAILDSGGTVRAVVGADEMRQLDLSTSSLVQDAVAKPSAQIWTFSDKVGVLAAAPVRLGDQVRALFMMGFAVEDSLLQQLERDLGATSAIFVGESAVASSTDDPELTRMLKATARLPQDAYRVVGPGFLGGTSRMSESAGAATVAWIVPRHAHAGPLGLLRGWPWLSAALVAILLALMIGLVLDQARAGRVRGGPTDRQGEPRS